MPRRTGRWAGSIFIKDWNFRGAVEQFQRAVALDPTCMNPATAYSQALTITRDLDGALGAIRDAQARLPVLPELLMQEGGVFFLAHRFEKMEAVGRELLTVDPEHTSRASSFEAGFARRSVSMRLRYALPRGTIREYCVRCCTPMEWQATGRRRWTRCIAFCRI